MSWSGAQPAQQPPTPKPKRRTGTPQVVIGIVLIALVLLGRAGGSAVPSDPAELAGFVFFNLAMVAGGVVLIVIGSRIKSSNRRADLAGRPASNGWPVQRGQYGQQPGQFGPSDRYGQQPGQYGQPGSSSQPGQYGEPWQYGQPGSSSQPGTYGQPGQYGQPGPSSQPDPSSQPGTYGQPGQPNQYGPAAQPGDAGHPGQYGPPGSYGGSQPPVERDRRS